MLLKISDPSAAPPDPTTEFEAAAAADDTPLPLLSRPFGKYFTCPALCKKVGFQMLD